ncbi:hypothetical protein, partial [Micromonospora maritima]
MTAGRRNAWRDWVAEERRQAAEQPRCRGKNPTWWDTGNEGNLQAFATCQTCPLPAIGECLPYEGATGVIIAGVAYDDRGRALTRCPDCWFPMPITSEAPQGQCKRRSCPANGSLPVALDSNRPRDYQQQITEMTLAGVTRSDICARLNLRERGVRHAQERWGLTGAKLAAHRAAVGSDRLAELRGRWLVPGP